jgi:hypothetical protein
LTTKLGDKIERTHSLSRGEKMQKDLRSVFLKR